MGEVFDFREECVTLERKNAQELNERIRKDEVDCEKAEKRKVSRPTRNTYEMYKNELFNRVWEEERVPRKWN